MREEILVHFLVEGVFTGVNFGGDDVPDGGSLKSVDDGLIGVNSERVGVEPDRVGKEERILGEAAELLADEGLRDFCDVLAIKEDLTGRRVGHAEESLDERAFAAAAATDEAELFAWTDGEGDVTEDGVGSRAAGEWISLFTARRRNGFTHTHIVRISRRIRGSPEKAILQGGCSFRVGVARRELSPQRS